MPQEDLWKALTLLTGLAEKDGPIMKTAYATAAEKGECYAAVARLLRQAGAKLSARDLGSHPALICSVLSRLFREGRVEIKARGKGYEADEARDASIAALVEALAAAKGMKWAVGEAASTIGRSPKAVREAYKRAERRTAEYARELGGRFCAECKGAGFTGADMGQCPTCAGSGLVPL